MRPLKYFIVAACCTIISSCDIPTSPEELINRKASLPSSFSLSDLHQKVISSFSNKKENTTSILYGDPSAEIAIKDQAPMKAPVFLFTLITWRQQADPHWFGAKIPGDLISVERLSKTANNASIAYQKLSGKELVRVRDTTGNFGRIKFILSQKPLILP